MNLLRRKSLEAILAAEPHKRLKPTLSWPHLVALGVGAIVGTGIYTLVGQAAGMAGPAVMISFVLAGLVCVCAALAYAEMSTMIPAAGSAYTYSYAVLGEALAWIVGWSLILEYTVVCSAVAIGWSGHAAEFLIPLGVPKAFLAGIGAGGIVNLPAMFITLAVTGLLLIGLRESASVNVGLVILKVLALGVFVAVAASHFDPKHFQPFYTHGFYTVENGQKLGVAPAAAIIFFAFYGFDAVSTAAEEAKNPARDLTIGIIGSLAACTVIYMAVAAAAVGAAPIPEFAKSPAPLVYILDKLEPARLFGVVSLGEIIAGAAVVALPTVIMAFMYGQSRIFFVMSRDGLLPHRLSTVNPRSGTPVLMTVVTGLLAAGLSGLMTFGDLVAVSNAGTLCAFAAVCVCLVVMRLRAPEHPRVFKAPLWPVVGVGGVIGCIALFWSLPDFTKLAFFAWNGIGLLLYFAYSIRASRLAKAQA